MTTTPRILCGVDFSKTSDAAFEHAVKLVRRMGGELHVVHAYGLSVAALPEGAVMTGPARAAELANEAQAKLDQWVSRHPDIDIAEHIVTGVASEEVLRIAEEIEPEIIVVGTHGRSGLKHLLFGSVAEQIIRKAPCPVLVVRGQG